MGKMRVKNEVKLMYSILTYPSKTNEEIAQMLGYSAPTIAKRRRLMERGMEQEFVRATADMFIQEFQAATHYWSMQISRLEELKVRKKKVMRNSTNGGSFEDEVDLDAMEILAIERTQADLKSRIVHQAAQGEVHEILKMMRNGKLSEYFKGR